MRYKLFLYATLPAIVWIAIVAMLFGYWVDVEYGKITVTRVTR